MNVIESKLRENRAVGKNGSAGGPPFFIFGCARSGTSLLSQMLNNHPNLAVPYESHLFNTFQPLLKYYGDLAVKENLERLVDDILSTDVMQDWSPKLERPGILSGNKIGNFGELMDAMLHSWAGVQNKARWGEKTPHHIYYWQEISGFFPDAKVIHIVRDGRDVALSLLKARFGPKTIYGAARYWVAYLQQVETAKPLIAPENYFETRYETLLEEPEQTLSQICDFLGEQYSPDLLDFYQNKTEYRTDKYNQANLQKPLLRDNKNKWRKLMRPADIAVFEAVAKESLVKYGYEVENPAAALSSGRKAYLHYVESPFSKFSAMLRNRKGHKDALIRSKIVLRLLWRYFLGNAR